MMRLHLNILLIPLMVAVVTAGSIGKIDASASSPDPDRVGHHGPPESPSINVNLESNILLTTLGITGESAANQHVVESATGNSDVPASLSSSSSTSAIVEMSGTADEVAIVGIPEEAVSTLNVVDTEFLTGASEQLQAALHGNAVAVEYSGGSVVPLGGGVTFTDAITTVDVVSAAHK